MFGLPTLLTGIALLAPRGSIAANCCSWKHEIDTDHLKKLADDFCADPMGHAYTKGTGKTEYWELNDGKYNILATHWERTFPNCAKALAEIIDQCQGKGFGVGTWSREVIKPVVNDNIGEFYSITADEVFDPKRRDLGDLTPLPTKGDVTSGTYSFDGHPLEVIIYDDGPGGHNQTRRGLLPGGPASASTGSLFRRNDQTLTTAYGEISDWKQTYTGDVDLAGLIASSARQKRRRSTMKKRLDDNWWATCDTKDHTYAVTAAGKWRTDIELASNIYMCGEGSECTRADTHGKTWSMAIKFGLNGEGGGDLASSLALNAGLDVGVEWTESYTESTTESCTWSSGHCHAIFHQISMGWTRGYQLLHHEWMVEVHVVHVDAPLEKGYHKMCDLGCCHPAVGDARRPDNLCREATDENRDWYGVCKDKGENPGNGNCDGTKS